MKIKITITMDEQQANWLLSALETLMDGWLEEEGSQKYRFFLRVRKTIERHLTQRALDAAEACDCGEPFPENGYCKFCGARQRPRQ